MLQPQNNVILDSSEQGTDEWLLARLGKFTASRAGDMMLTQKNGKWYAKRYDYVTQVALERITGKAPEPINAPILVYGREMEATAALAYEFKTGNITRETGFWHFRDKNIGASPDRLLVESPGIVEIKNLQPKTHLQVLQAQEVPEFYYWQVIQQMLVTGAQFADFVSHQPLFPEASRLFIKTIEREAVKSDIDRLLQALLDAEEEVITQVKFIERYKA